MTSVGQSYVAALNNNLSESTIDAFIENCGTNIVQTTYTGQSLQYIMNLDFSSASEKSSLQSSINASYGSMASMSASIIAEGNQSSSTNVQVNASIIQYGGNPGSSTSLAANMPNYSQCSANESGLNQACFDAETDFTNFVASSAYQEQLTENNQYNAVIQYPDMISFPTTGINPGALTQLESAIAAYNLNYGVLNNKWLANSEIHAALAPFVQGSISNQVEAQIETDYKNSGSNISALENILTNECQNGVCTLAALAQYKPKPISPQGISFANLLQTNYTVLGNGLLFSCINDVVQINLGSNSNISALTLSSGSISQSFNSAGGAITINGICSSTNWSQSTDLVVGFIQLAGIPESSPEAYVPFVLNRDPIFSTYTVSQNEGASTGVGFGTGANMTNVVSGSNNTLNQTIQPYNASWTGNTLAITFAATVIPGVPCATDICQAIKKAGGI